MMKHRDRVQMALNHQEPDRCPMQISFTPEFAARLKADMALKGQGLHHPCYNTTEPCPATSRAPGPGGEKPYTLSAPTGVAIASPVAVLAFDAGGRPNIAAQLAIQVNGTGTHAILVERETGYVHD